MFVEMVKVPAGSFKMGGGDLKNRPDALPTHHVTISRIFDRKEPVKYKLFASFTGKSTVKSRMPKTTWVS